MEKFYKVRNKQTGLFFNKDSYKESEKGSTFKILSAAERLKGYISDYPNVNANHDTLEIVVFGLVEISVVGD